MEVFHHHLNEFERGLRNLILHTTKIEYKNDIENRLNEKKISYLIHDIGKDKINIFFGDRYCIDIIKSINKPNLTHYTEEEDFILGIMLGYDSIKQCKRYLKLKFKKEMLDTLIG